MSKKFSLIIILGLCSYGVLNQEAHGIMARDMQNCINNCLNMEIEAILNNVCPGDRPYGNTPEHCKNTWRNTEKEKTCRQYCVLS